MLEEISVGELLIALAAIGGAVAVVVKAIKPFNELVDKVKDHDTMLQRDLDRLNNNEKLTKAMARSMLQMQNHMIDGNHTNQLIESRDKLQEALTEIA